MLPLITASTGLSVEFLSERNRLLQPPIITVLEIIFFIFFIQISNAYDAQL